ncbi:MAG: glycosyltransferase family 4 protein [Candidatus Microsaccharimonas sp.]
MKIRLDLSPLASQHRSGVAQYTRLLSEALASTDGTSLYGHYFDFLNRQPKPELSIQPKKTNVNKLVPLRFYAKSQSYNIAPPFDLFLPKVDLTIFPNFATWPAINSKHTATVIHDLTYLYFPEVVEEKNLAHLRRVVPGSIKKADFIITVSKSVKAELIKEFGLAPEKCVVTPIPSDESFFTIASKEQISAVKEKYKISPDKKYLYFIGNLEPRKNLKTLIEAYRLLPKEAKDEYSLILAGGKGWKTEETQQALDEAIKAGEDIKHLGFIDQKDSPVLYQGASLFVMPSLYEGFGMPVLEAMASGTPVVASDIPVLREVGSTYASYANPHSPESFKDAILEALTKPTPKRSDLQKNVTRYSWEDNVNKIIKATNSLNS